MDPITSPEDLFVRFRVYLLRIARRHCRTYEDAEDALQSAMLLIYRHWDQRRDRSTALTWAHTVLLNVCRDQHRKRMARDGRFGIVSVDYLVGHGAEPTVPSEEAAIAAKLLLAFGIQPLNEIHTAALALLLEAGYANNDPKSTMKVRQVRARLKVRARIEAADARFRLQRAARTA